MREKEIKGEQEGAEDAEDDHDKWRVLLDGDPGNSLGSCLYSLGWSQFQGSFCLDWKVCCWRFLILHTAVGSLRRPHEPHQPISRTRSGAIARRAAA